MATEYGKLATPSFPCLTHGSGSSHSNSLRNIILGFTNAGEHQPKMSYRRAKDVGS